jgi:tetratricopeptide (TPR) repeat protein
VLVNLATVYLNQERWETAHRALNLALDMDPTLAVAHERLGYCLWRRQEYEASEACYRKAIELDPRNAPARAGIGVVLMTRYLEQPEEVILRDRAVESWHVSLELDPNQPKLRELVEKYRPKTDEPTLSFE